MVSDRRRPAIEKSPIAPDTPLAATEADFVFNAVHRGSNAVAGHAAFNGLSRYINEHRTRTGNEDLYYFAEVDGQAAIPPHIFKEALEFLDCDRIKGVGPQAKRLIELFQTDYENRTSLDGHDGTPLESQQ